MGPNHGVALNHPSQVLPNHPSQVDANTMLSTTTSIAPCGVDPGVDGIMIGVCPSLARASNGNGKSGKGSYGSGKNGKGTY